MRKHYVPANALSWAAALLAAAALKAPDFLALVLLPGLATPWLLTAASDAGLNRSHAS